MESMFVFTGIVTKNEGDEAYASLCPELDVASMGATAEEAKTMLLDAAKLHIEGAIEDGVPYLRPVPADEDPRNEDSASIVEVFRFKVDVLVNVHA